MLVADPDSHAWADRHELLTYWMVALTHQNITGMGVRNYHKQKQLHPHGDPIEYSIYLSSLGSGTHH